MSRIGNQMLAAYRRQIVAKGELVTLRRGSGPDANNSEAHAFVTSFDSDELVGDIRQSDVKVIVLAEDLTLDPPVEQGDRILIGGAPHSIVAPPDARTRKVGGVLLAYVLVARG